MPRFREFEPKGVIPACLLPFRDDFSIDEAGYRKHLRDVVGVAGISAITVNAHASEAAACSEEEQERVLALTMDEVGRLGSHQRKVPAPRLPSPAIMPYAAARRGERRRA